VFALLTVMLAGCAAPSPVAEPTKTMLLVRLSDGTFVRQEIVADADVCMKSNDDSRTMCLRRGEPIIDEARQVVVGYRMQRSEIQLIPK
jgi:hypothetical protein